MVREKQVYRPKRVFAVALRLAQEAEKKRERKRGRPPTYLNHLYLALPYSPLLLQLDLPGDRGLLPRPLPG